MQQYGKLEKIMSNFVTKMFYKQREEFETSARIRDSKLPFPETVEEQKDIRYASDSCEAHRYDRFRPKGREGEVLPVIINVHGGGLLLGSKEFNRFYCARLCEMGYLVYSVEYRLVPDCLFFDQLADVFLAMDYIKEQIKADGGDSNLVYGVADSGGACLLMYATAMQQNKKLAAAAHVTPSALHCRALGFISGMFYTNRHDKIGMFLPKYLYGADYKKSEFAPYINPEHKDIVTSLPSCFLVTSHNDHLEKYTLDFTKALERYHKPYQMVNYPKNKVLTHAFSVFDPYLEESTQAMKSMVQFFNKINRVHKEEISHEL